MNQLEKVFPQTIAVEKRLDEREGAHQGENVLIVAAADAKVFIRIDHRSKIGNHELAEVIKHERNFEPVGSTK